MAAELKAHLALRLQHAGVLPHHAANLAGQLIEEEAMDGAQSANIDVLYQAAIARTSERMFANNSSGPRSVAADVDERSVAAQPSAVRRKLPRVVLKRHAGQKTVDPNELVWSPEKSGRNFKVPPPNLLKPPSDGLYTQMSLTAQKVAKAQGIVEKAKIKAANEELRVALDAQMAERRLAALREDRAHAAEEAATRAHVSALKKQAVQEYYAKIQATAQTKEEIAAFNRDQKARAAAEAKAERQEEEARNREAARRVAEEQAKAERKAKAIKEEMKRAIRENDKVITLKRLAIAKSREEDAKLATAAKAAAEAAEARRKAEIAAREAAMAAKLAKVGEVIRLADNADRLAAEKAAREADALAQQRAAAAAAKEAERKASLRECGVFQQQQLRDKAKARAVERLEEQREAERIRIAAKQAAAEDRARQAAAREKLLALRMEVEQHVYDNARAKVVGAVDRNEELMHNQWMSEQAKKIEEGKAAAAMLRQGKVKAGGSRPSLASRNKK